MAANLVTELLILTSLAIYTPSKTNMDTQNDAIFERRYILKTISFGIYCMLDFAGGSNWYLSGNEIGSIEVQVMNATCGEYHHT